MLPNSAELILLGAPSPAVHRSQLSPPPKPYPSPLLEALTNQSQPSTEFYSGNPRSNDDVVRPTGRQTGVAQRGSTYPEDDTSDFALSSDSLRPSQIFCNPHTSHSCPYLLSIARSLDYGFNVQERLVSPGGRGVACRLWGVEVEKWTQGCTRLCMANLAPCIVM